jgi:hypothetical protein
MVIFLNEVTGPGKMLDVRHLISTGRSMGLNLKECEASALRLPAAGESLYAFDLETRPTTHL